RALAMSSIFPALLPTSPPSTLFPYTTLFRSVFQPPESLPRPRRLVVQPHAMVAVRSPGTLGQLQRRARGMGFEVLRRGHRADTVRTRAAQRAIRRSQEVRPFEPPMPEQLRIEWRHDDAVPSPVSLL